MPRGKNSRNLEILARDILEILSYYTPMLMRELHNRICREYGEISERQIFRALALLKKSGEVTSTRNEVGRVGGYLRVRKEQKYLDIWEGTSSPFNNTLTGGRSNRSFAATVNQSLRNRY